MRIYVTFGQTHRHEIDGQIFDKDCVAVIDEVGLDSFPDIKRLFGVKWSREFSELAWDEETQLSWYPRGYKYLSVPLL